MRQKLNILYSKNLFLTRIVVQVRSKNRYRTITSSNDLVYSMKKCTCIKIRIFQYHVKVSKTFALHRIFPQQSSTILQWIKTATIKATNRTNRNLKESSLSPEPIRRTIQNVAVADKKRNGVRCNCI